MAYSNTNRFVFEDSIAKVTMDGEPHEMMTLVAALSGAVAAFAVLAVLVFIVGCRDEHEASPNQSSRTHTQTTTTESSAKRTIKKTPSLLPLFFKQDSTVSMDDSPQIMSISVISESGGKENFAFSGSSSNLYEKNVLRASFSTDKF